MRRRTLISDQIDTLYFRRDNMKSLDNICLGVS